MSRAPRFALVALAAGTLFVADAPTAHAWQCFDDFGGCATWCDTPVPYALNAISSDLGDAGTEAEVRRGFEDWTRVSCTSLTTQWNGRTTTVAGAQSSDRQSVVGWRESSWPHGAGAIGVTGPKFGFGGCITEADMEMNGVNYTWITGSGVGNDVNAYSIILHEAGHYFGLDHSSQRSATMFAAYGGGVLALSADDQEGICTLYPGEGGGPTDCTTTGCPPGEVCMAGTCVAEPTGGSALGESCTADADCDSGMCRDTGAGQVCTQSCDDLAPGASCPGGFYCQRGAVCGQGLCVAGAPGALAAGEACTLDTDCATLVCDRGVCATPCQDGGPTCGAGTTCTVTGTACGACLTEADAGGGIGFPCTTRDECATAECAYRDGTGFCTDFCTDQSMCPMGYLCSEVAPDLSVCSPAPPRDDGCGCSVPGASGTTSGHLWLFLLVIPAIVLRRRRR